MLTANSCLLTKEDMKNPDRVPRWLIKEYQTFHNTVMDKTFPCYFGMNAEKKVSFVMHILHRKIGPISQKLWKAF